MKDNILADLLIVPYSFGLTMLIAHFVRTDDPFGGKWFIVFFSASLLLAYPNFVKGRTLFWGGEATLLKWSAICFVVLIFGLIWALVLFPT